MDRTGTILIVEDDDDLRELLRIAGEKRSYRTRAAGNGLEAVESVETDGVPDLIILDINMPGMDGITFCRKLRNEHPTIPVIFLSARADEYDKIVALEIGGDDYLTKPFSMEELFARVEVALRRVEAFRLRAEGNGGGPGIESDGIVLHPDAWTCTFMGEEISLTVSEYRILWRLMKHPGRVVTREELARAAFPEDRYNTGRSIDMHIHRIRRKLRDVSPDFDSLETVYQVGYKWNE